MTNRERIIEIVENRISELPTSRISELLTKDYITDKIADEILPLIEKRDEIINIYKKLTNHYEANYLPVGTKYFHISRQRIKNITEKLRQKLETLKSELK